MLEDQETTIEEKILKPLMHKTFPQILVNRGNFLLCG